MKAQIYFLKVCKNKILSASKDNQICDSKTEWHIGTLIGISEKITKFRKQEEYENNIPDVIGILTLKREYSFLIFTIKELREKTINFFKEMPLEIFIILQKEAAND